LSARYLRIIMLGLVFSFIYNYMASMLRAMGDSKSPLIFLAVSALLNIAGDMVLVVTLRLGVMGAALSTVLCEALSAFLCWVYVYQKVPLLRLGRGWLYFDFGLLKTTLSYGIVSALQQATVQAGKLAVQAFVNTLGVNATAAFNATNRIDDFAIVPEQNMAHAMSSCMAQNVGAGEYKRVRGVFRWGMTLETGFGVLVGVFLFVMAEPLIGLFTKDPHVLEEGVRFLRVAAFLYPMPGITNGIQGYFRGIGNLRVTLVSSLLNMSVRAFSCYALLFWLKGDFSAIPWSYMAGWVAMSVYEVPVLISSLRKQRLGKAVKED
ncbi:MAG: polysaccharide biosynthesis C-terminal domain-containing protein, partial [Blautia sp.]|nr:polysaccharide biosynthesis C-terminal domain-containing protein [Blautia sp.]